MRIKILEEPVKDNIALFFNELKSIEKQPLANEKKFQAWLDCHSGQLFFIKPEIETKPVVLSYHYDPSLGEIEFLIEEKEGRFYLGDLSDKALRIFRSTMKSLEQVARRLKGPSNLKVKLSVLSKLIVDIENSEDRNILIAVWHHPIDRLHAERLLKQQPIGSFLFRKDPFANMLEDQLITRFHKPLKCFTLTVSEPENKVSDYTIIYIDEEWQLYNDDPSLQQPSFSTLRELLKATPLKEVAKYPLYHGSYGGPSELG